MQALARTESITVHMEDQNFTTRAKYVGDQRLHYIVLQHVDEHSVGVQVTYMYLELLGPAILQMYQAKSNPKSLIFFKALAY